MEQREIHLESLALTYRQVARAANISERTVRKLVRRGDLAAVRIGRSVRVPRAEVLRLCGGRQTSGSDGFDGS